MSNRLTRGPTGSTADNLLRPSSEYKRVPHGMSQFARNTDVKFDHVQIAAPPGCEAEARRFYGGLLGLPEVPKPEPMRATGGVWFALGAQGLHIGIEAGFVPARKAHPAIRVAPDALDALAAGLADAG